LPFNDYIRAKSSDKFGVARTFFIDVEGCKPTTTCLLSWTVKELGIPQGVEGNVVVNGFQFTARLAFEFDATNSTFDPFTDKIKEIKLRGKNNATDTKRGCDIRAMSSPLSLLEMFNGTIDLGVQQPIMDTRNLNDLITVGTVLYDASVEGISAPCAFSDEVVREITLDEDAIYAVERQLQRNTVSGNNGISFGVVQEIFAESFDGRVIRWLEPEIQINFFTTEAVAVQIFNQTETDIVTVLDTVELTLIAQVNQTDTATVTDQVQLNVTKAVQDVTTVLDTVETTLIAEVNQNDVTTIVDEFHHNTTKVIRNVEFGSAGNVTIFSDDFTVDPAGNGWTETFTPLTDATGTIALHSTLTEAILAKTGGGFEILLETDRVIDTTGFTDIRLNFTARQDIGGVYEPFDFIKIEIDTGSGFVTLLEDRQKWFGVNDLIGDGVPFIGGNFVGASTGFISLPSLADNNANLGIRLSTNPDDVTKDVYWMEFELIGIPSDIVVIFSDDFSVDPASNGWTESTSQFQVLGFPATATGTITQETISGSSVAELEKTALVSGIELIIDRVIDTTGFTDIAFNLTAFQGNTGTAGAGSNQCLLEKAGTGEPVNAFRVFIDYGSGFDDTPYLTDMQKWFGVNGTVGISTCETIEGDAFGNQDTPTATGLLALNSSANNNPNLGIRITYTTATASADGYIDNFELVSTSGGGGTGRFTGDLATVLDQIQLNMTGSISDVVVTSDTVVVTRTIDVNQTDTTTVTDQTNLITNKRPIDIATILDNVDILAPPNAINDLTAISPALPSEVRCNLLWTEPNDNGSPINGYGVFSAVDGGSYITLIANTSSTVTAFNHTGLNAGSTYSYNVTSFNAFGDSEQSNIPICIPQPPQTPSIPTGLTAVNQQADVFLDWDHDQQGKVTR